MRISRIIFGLQKQPFEHTHTHTQILSYLHIYTFLTVNLRLIVCASLVMAMMMKRNSFLFRRPWFRWSTFIRMYLSILNLYSCNRRTFSLRDPLSRLLSKHFSFLFSQLCVRCTLAHLNVSQTIFQLCRCTCAAYLFSLSLNCINFSSLVSLIFLYHH